MNSFQEHCKKRDEAFEKRFHHIDVNESCFDKDGEPDNAVIIDSDGMTRYGLESIKSFLHAERIAVLEWAQENHSDGYHTFNELYEHRFSLFSVVCKAYNGWKSKLHSDGTMYDGWFVAGVETPKGQATYHMPMAWWGKFPVHELEKAPQYDGHTPNDVIERIHSLLDGAMKENEKDL